METERQGCPRGRFKIGVETNERNSIFTLLHSWFLPSTPANSRARAAHLHRGNGVGASPPVLTQAIESQTSLPASALNVLNLAPIKRASVAVGVSMSPLHTYTNTEWDVDDSPSQSEVLWDPKRRPNPRRHLTACIAKPNNATRPPITGQCRGSNNSTENMVSQDQALGATDCPILLGATQPAVVKATPYLQQGVSSTSKSTSSSAPASASTSSSVRVQEGSSYNGGTADMELQDQISGIQPSPSDYSGVGHCPPPSLSTSSTSTVASSNLSAQWTALEDFSSGGSTMNVQRVQDALRRIALLARRRAVSASCASASDLMGGSTAMTMMTPSDGERSGSADEIGSVVLAARPDSALDSGSSISTSAWGTSADAAAKCQDRIQEVANMLMKLLKNPPSGPESVTVIMTEENGSAALMNTLMQHASSLQQDVQAGGTMRRGRLRAVSTPAVVKPGAMTDTVAIGHSVKDAAVAAAVVVAVADDTGTGQQQQQPRRSFQQGQAAQRGQVAHALAHVAQSTSKHLEDDSSEQQHHQQQPIESSIRRSCGQDSQDSQSGQVQAVAPLPPLPPLLSPQSLSQQQQRQWQVFEGDRHSAGRDSLHAGGGPRQQSQQFPPCAYGASSSLRQPNNSSASGQDGHNASGLPSWSPFPSQDSCWSSVGGLTSDSGDGPNPYASLHAQEQTILVSQLERLTAQYAQLQWRHERLRGAYDAQVAARESVIRRQEETLVALRNQCLVLQRRTRALLEHMRLAGPAPVPLPPPLAAEVETGSAEE